MLGCKTVTAPSGSCTWEPHGWGHGAGEEGNETSLTLSLVSLVVVVLVLMARGV